jgi:hypothetical protein
MTHRMPPSLDRLAPELRMSKKKVGVGETLNHVIDAIRCSDIE